MRTVGQVKVLARAPPLKMIWRLNVSGFSAATCSRPTTRRRAHRLPERRFSIFRIDCIADLNHRRVGHANDCACLRLIQQGIATFLAKALRSSVGRNSKTTSRQLSSTVSSREAPPGPKTASASTSRRLRGFSFAVSAMSPLPVALLIPE